MAQILDALQDLFARRRLHFPDDDFSALRHRAIAILRHPTPYKLAVTRNTSSTVVRPARHLATPSSAIVVMPSASATFSSSIASTLGPMAARRRGVTSITSNTP